MERGEPNLQLRSVYLKPETNCVHPIAANYMSYPDLLS